MRTFYFPGNIGLAFESISSIAMHGKQVTCTLHQCLEWEKNPDQYR